MINTTLKPFSPCTSLTSSSNLSSCFLDEFNHEYYSDFTSYHLTHSFPSSASSFPTSALFFIITKRMLAPASVVGSLEASPYSRFIIVMIMRVLNECFSFMQRTTQVEESLAGNKNIVNHPFFCHFFNHFLCIVIFSCNVCIYKLTNATTPPSFLQNPKSPLFIFLSQGILCQRMGSGYLHDPICSTDVV